MADASDIMGMLHQNLMDAGCGENMIKDCMELAAAEKWACILPLLSKQRSDLLKAVHVGQKQIDCLDFLVYKINKKHIQEDRCNGRKA